MDQDSADAGVMGRQEGNCWNQPGLETWTVQTPPPHALGHAVSWGGGDLARGAGCAPTLYSGLRRGWGDNLDIEHETTGLSLFAIPHDVPSAPGPWNLSLSQNWPCCTGLAEASMAAPNGFFFFLKGGPSLLQRPMRMSIFLAEGPCCKAKGSGGCVFLGLDSCTYPILSNNCLRPIRCQALCGHEALTLMSKAMCLPWHKLCSCYSPLFLFFYLTNSGSPCSPRGGSHKTSYPDGADRGRAST